MNNCVCSTGSIIYQAELLVSPAQLQGPSVYSSEIGRHVLPTLNRTDTFSTPANQAVFPNNETSLSSSCSETVIINVVQKQYESAVSPPSVLQSVQGTPASKSRSLSPVYNASGKNYMKTPQIDGLLVSRGEGRFEKLIKCEVCGKVCRTSNMARHRKQYCLNSPAMMTKKEKRKDDDYKIEMVRDSEEGASNCSFDVQAGYSTMDCSTDSKAGYTSLNTKGDNLSVGDSSLMESSFGSPVGDNKQNNNIGGCLPDQNQSLVKAEPL